jgi:Zn-dependent peptidase ImmA (M78 family)
MTPGQQAETRITELGIRDPKDLDVEAIAFDAGMYVEYAALVGCEAMLVGVGNRAIATINPSNVRGRERFSIGHELGHWAMHRGQSFECRVDDPTRNLESNVILERQADEYSSHLLMPAYLFNPVINTVKWPTLTEIQGVANEFQSSQTATLIRLANVDTLPVIVACYSAEKRLWHLAAPHVPRRWWLKRVLDQDTFAYDLLTQGRECNTPRKQSADAWFENNDACEFEVLEQCLPTSPGKILVTLYLSDGEMFDRGYDPDVGWRK